MTEPTKDRSYYRLQTTGELEEEAKYNPNIELCIALGERIDTLRGEVEADFYEDFECPRCGFIKC